MSDERIPNFCLSAHDAAQLTDILTRYGPYSNGQTALFWHLTGIIGSSRKQTDPEEAIREVLGSANETFCDSGEPKK